ncbi:ParB-like protein [Vibrio anguillarum]|uniref:ParB-like protein n=1 Tax=Vibrio anguillarum TaxID=55601 RepID=UPI0002D746C9|nr:ParB-like protein [Vibrio anguillarum]OEE39966.1 chromosome partitioning protein ParB [Vibrio anguillarum]
MLSKGWILLAAAIISQGTWALAPCGTDSGIGDWCSLDINQLHPTQAGVGQQQVDKTQAKLATKSPAQLKKYMKKKKIPVIVDADGQYWLVDRHHLTKALWQQGVKEVTVHILAHLDNKESFWQDMQGNHWTWLRDEKGAPLTPDQLPAHISKLPDYPYRSLAGELQDAGYYSKHEQVYFVEFAWASWLGEQMNWVPVNASTLPERLEQAAQLACSSAAKALPGYPGEQCSTMRHLINTTN